MTTNIIINNQAEQNVTYIDIDGVIGACPHNEEARTAANTYEEFRAKVNRIKQINAKNVVVNIRSTGGNLNDAILIYEALKELDAQITTRCYGYVASAATIIAQAASAGLREISQNAMYLVHKAVMAAEGNQTEMKQTILTLQKTDETIARIYALRGGIEMQVIEELMSRNNGNGVWLNAKQTVEMKLADRIIQQEEISKEAKKLIVNMGLPPIPGKLDRLKSQIVRKWTEIAGFIAEENREVDESDKTMLAVSGVAHESVADKIDNLENKIAQLEAANIKMNVLPTETEMKDDPAPQERRVLSQNQLAYLNDLSNFSDL